MTVLNATLCLVTKMRKLTISPNGNRTHNRRQAFKVTHCAIAPRMSHFSLISLLCEDMFKKTIFLIIISTTYRISLHEMSLHWAILFSLIELGHADLISIPVDFIIAHPNHYCADLVVKVSRGFDSIFFSSFLYYI